MECLCQDEVYHYNLTPQGYHNLSTTAATVNIDAQGEQRAGQLPGKGLDRQGSLLPRYQLGSMFPCLDI